VAGDKPGEREAEGVGAVSVDQFQRGRRRCPSTSTIRLPESSMMVAWMITSGKGLLAAELEAPTRSCGPTQRFDDVPASSRSTWVG